MEKGYLLKDELIDELIKALINNNMKDEANCVFELCLNIDSLEKKLDDMIKEVSEVKQQLKEVKQDNVVNTLKNKLYDFAENIEKGCTKMKKQLDIIKENVRDKAHKVVHDFRKQGKVALYNVQNICGMKDKLEQLRDNVKESRSNVAKALEKIDMFSKEMRSATMSVANAFRVVADKEIVKYDDIDRGLSTKDSSKDSKRSKFSKTELFKKPWIAKEKLLSSLERRIDKAIENAEDLERYVEIDKMMKEFDKVMGEKKEERGR